MKTKRGRPRGLRVGLCACGRHVTTNDGKKRVTCPCGKIVVIGARKPRASGVFKGYLLS